MLRERDGPWSDAALRKHTRILDLGIFVHDLRSHRNGRQNDQRRKVKPPPSPGRYDAGVTHAAPTVIVVASRFMVIGSIPSVARTVRFVQIMKPLNTSVLKAIPKMNQIARDHSPPQLP